MTTVSTILLAAGESTRMGQSKALLNWHGQALLQHQVHTVLAAGCQEVIVVLGYQASRLRPLVPKHSKVHVVVNRGYRAGKTTSIRLGLRQISPDSVGVLIMGVDQTGSSETIASLVSAFRESQPTIAIPSYRGQSGHPPIFHVALLPELLGITEDTQGIRSVVERYRYNRLSVDVDDPLVVLNLNTPEDYRLANDLTALRG